jgi:hypothetical protein
MRTKDTLQAQLLMHEAAIGRSHVHTGLKARRHNEGGLQAR